MVNLKLWQALESKQFCEHLPGGSDRAKVKEGWHEEGGPEQRLEG